jgi:hypothetical protein
VRTVLTTTIYCNIPENYNIDIYGRENLSTLSHLFIYFCHLYNKKELLISESVSRCRPSRASRRMIGFNSNYVTLDGASTQALLNWREKCRLPSTELRSSHY